MTFCLLHQATSSFIVVAKLQKSFKRNKFTIHKINPENQVIYTNQKQHISFIESAFAKSWNLSSTNDHHVHSNKTFCLLLVLHSSPPKADPKISRGRRRKTTLSKSIEQTECFVSLKSHFQHEIYRLRRAHNNNGYLINYGIIVMENWAQMCAMR